MIVAVPYQKNDYNGITASIAAMTRQFNLNEGLQPEDDRLRRWDRQVVPTVK